MNGSVNPLTTKLFRVRKTVFKMITKRGYSVDDNDMNMTLDTFLRELCDAEGNPNLNNMTIPARRIDSDDDNDRIVVFFIRGNDKKINGKEFEAKVAQMATDHVKRVILVFGGELTSDAKKKLSSSSTPDMIVEGFLEDELVVDITEHELVPEHQLLTPVEKTNLLKQYGLEERQLPRIQKSDPIARYFGAQRGQVFRIVRKSETAGKYVTYRIV
ncbi:hypothetical protein WA588_002399, partial [Blastocystis sp. NMH]